MNRLELISDGLRKMGAAYIERPDFEIDDYRTMVLMYLVERLLKDQDAGQDLDLNAEYPHGHFGVLTLTEGVIAFSPRGVEVHPR